MIYFQETGLVNPSEGNDGDVARSNSPSLLHSKQDKKKPKLIKSDQALNCPRCNSTNTKFCYYNNYNPTQPRYLCKACRRYWTHGGTLRNVPVGGSSRKKIKPSLGTPSLSNNSKLFLDLNPKSTNMSSSNFLPNSIPPTRTFMHQFNHDLNMGLYYANNSSNHHHFLPIHGDVLSSYNHVSMSTSSQAMNEVNPRTYYPSLGLHFQDIVKPTLDLCMDGGFGGTNTTTNTNTNERSDVEGLGRIPYLYEDHMKQDSTTITVADNIGLAQGNGHVRDHNINGHVLYWNNNNHGEYN